MAGYVVGVAGGIGSGKTAVSERFRAHGIDVVDADVEARRVVAPGQPALAEIAARFGAGILLEDGALDRSALRRKVFADPSERRWLERLTHPQINAAIAAGLQAATSPYAILVNPLMRARDPRAHRILVVDVPEAVQVQRTMARDGVTEAQARAVLASQIDRAGRLAFADDVIVNDRTLADLEAAVDLLHRQYLRRAAFLQTRPERDGGQTRQ